MKRLVCLALFFGASLAFAAETLKIDFRYNTRADDGKNHLHWQTKDVKAKDRFDALTGASAAKSTKLLRALQTTGKKKAFPKGLYALLLFAVSPSAQAETDTLTVTAEGARLTISFLHRGNAYQITTDEKGALSTRTSFLLAAGIMENAGGVFTVKADFLTETETTAEEADTTAREKSADEDTDNAPSVQADEARVTDPDRIDWNKVVFEPDDYDEDAETIWDGTLRAAFADGVLTITGKLKKIAPSEKPTPANAENEDEAEPTGGVTGDVPPLEGGAENGSEADG